MPEYVKVQVVALLVNGKGPSCVVKPEEVCDTVCFYDWDADSPEDIRLTKVVMTEEEFENLPEFTGW